MPVAIREAQVSWEGTLAAGRGELKSGSGALDGREVTWASRTQLPDGRTSPEELCAAAHSSCFAMALALTFGEGGVPPGHIDVSAAVTLDEVNGRPTIVSSRLTVEALIPELEIDQFDALISQAAALCPVSRLFTGAKVSVQAQLLDGAGPTA